MNKMLRTIKFTHEYTKLLDGVFSLPPKAILLQVLEVKIEDLSKEFIDYDTDAGKFSLPKKGAYLMLIFLKQPEERVPDKNLFTTLRRSTPEKKKYYQECVGDTFLIKIQNSVDPKVQISPKIDL